MPKETIKSRLDRFIENDFHHLALEVANLKGQMKLVLAGLSALLLMMSAIVAGLAMEVLK
jgi:hypothetical protein